MTTSPAACPSCGGSLDAGQEYCLRCGARALPLRRTSSLESAWEARLGRYPGDWALASALLLLVAAGSAAAGIVTSHRGQHGGRGTIVAISPVVSAPVTASVPATVTAAAPTRTTTKPTSPAPRTTGALAVWPARNGYTVVLASVPARGNGLKEATAKATAARRAGVRGVGVLTSSTFASLHPGYYVVFAGVYGSLADAQTAAGELSAKFPNAYARQITR